MKTLTELLPDWRLSLSSPKTARVYSVYARYFIAWVSELQSREAAPSDLSTPMLRAYQEHRRGLGIIANTRRLELSALVNLAKWLVDTDELSAVPYVRMPREEPQHRTVPTDTEVFALLDSTERFLNAKRCALAHFVLRLFVHTGIRRAELLSLTLSDISLEKRQLNVRNGKGNKQRFLPICNELAEAYCEYTLSLPSRDGTGSAGGLLDNPALSGLFRELRVRSGQKTRTHLQPHGLRHWFACNTYKRMLERGEPDPMRKLALLLGHASTKTTEIYLQGLGVDIANCAEYTAIEQPTTARLPEKPIPKDRGTAQSLHLSGKRKATRQFRVREDLGKPSR